MTTTITTQKQAMSEIRFLGLTCTYSADWQEFIVNYPKGDGRRTKDSDYRCSDPQDAVDTARAMAAAR